MKMGVGEWGDWGDLPRARAFYGGPLCELRNQENGRFYGILKQIRASIDGAVNLYNLETYTQSVSKNLIVVSPNRSYLKYAAVKLIK